VTERRCAGKRIDPEARGVVCAVKRAAVIGQRISGQHQGQRIQLSARKAEDMTAPTISATAKKPLISGRHPDMTTPFRTWPLS
jgi:hypothetical protein